MTSVDQAPPRGSAANAGIDLALRMGGLLAAIVVVALVFIAINPNVANLNMGASVLRSMSSVAIMALGLTLVIVVGEIDLSFGATYGLAVNGLAVMWIFGGIPVYVAIPLAILIGTAVGLFNGLLVTSLRIPSFIVTLGSYNLLYGISLWVSNTATFNPVYPPPGTTIPKEQIDFFVGLSESVCSWPLSRFSARFSLIDFPDFLDMPCRGDLSLMWGSL